MSPRLQRLEMDFKAGGGTFEEYRLGDLFESSNGDFDIQQKHINGEGEYVVSSGEQNSGIIGKSNVQARVFAGNTITIDMFGSVKYRSHKYKMVTHARVFSLTSKFKDFSELSALYFVTSMSYFKSIFSYNNMASWEKVKNINLSLPTHNGSIAFTYMERVIRELEEERIRELDAYLEASGLEDTELTAAEKAAVERLRSGNVAWKEFKVGELFDIHPTKAYKYTNAQLFHKDGKYPVVTNSSVNNGITGYSNLEPTEKGNMITYSDTTTSEGIFYQSDDFVGYSHVQGLYPRKSADKWNEKTLLYFVSLFRISAGGRFDYANKFNRAIASEMFVALPATSSGAIDFEFMDNLISAESRLAIRGVVAWRDKVIAKTKDVVG